MGALRFRSWSASAAVENEKTKSLVKENSLSSTSMPNLRTHDSPISQTSCSRTKPVITYSSSCLSEESKTSKDSQEVNPFELRVISCIGRGSFGRVLLLKGVGTCEGNSYALKEVPKVILAEKAGIQKVVTEKKILDSMKGYPFIVDYHAAWQDDKKAYLLMDFVNGFELFNLMQEKGSLSEPVVRLYAAEIVLALNHLHENRILYQDLKPENILIDRSGHIKLCDFGLSRIVAKNRELRVKTSCGTPEYLPPEIILLKKDHGKAVDYWALGVLVYEMLYEVTPFYDSDRNQMYYNIVHQKLWFPIRNKCRRDIISSQISKECKSFIAGLLRRNEYERLGSRESGFEDLVSHPWFKSLEFEKVLSREILPEYVPVVKDKLDVSNFDKTFTEETVAYPEACSRALNKNISLSDYEWLQPGFSEEVWYKRS